MTESILVSVIMCLCGPMNKDAKPLCMETYVNCAVIKGGEILSKEDFKRKCDFVPTTQKCLDKAGN